MKLDRRFRYWLAGGLVLLVLGGASVGAYALTSRAASSPDGGAVSYTKSRLRSSGVAISSNPTDALNAVLSRYGGRSVVEAGIGQPPDIEGARSGTYLDFTVTIPGMDERANRSLWEADLVQGAVADALALGGGTAVVGSSISLKLPDGTIRTNMGGGMGDIVTGQKFESPDDGALIDTLTSKLSKFQLNPLSIEILHANQPAPAVVAETSNPRLTAQDASTIVDDLFGRNPPLYEGYYFEVRDSNGDRLFIQSASFRTGAGRLWIRPDLEGAISLHHG